jgi:uncharacterized protein
MAQLLSAPETEFRICQQLATELKATAHQVVAAIALLDGGATVPFISRYRKEATGGLDDTQLRLLDERLRYLRELEERRAQIIESIQNQEKLTPELLDALQIADTKARLEDLYLPYKPKRRSKAQAAKEAGLEPLAHALLQDPTLDPQTAAQAYLNPEHQINDGDAALSGARFILMEQFSEEADILGKARDYVWQNAQLKSTLTAGSEEKGQKFKDYFDYIESLNKVPCYVAVKKVFYS